MVSFYDLKNLSNDKLCVSMINVIRGLIEPFNTKDTVQ